MAERSPYTDGDHRVTLGAPEHDRIVRIARSYVGTPWKHQGRGRAGLDCVGLLYRVWCDLGLDPSVDGTGYGHVSDGRWLREMVSRLLVRVTGPRSGGVVLMAQRGMHPLHVVIVSVLREESSRRAERGPRVSAAQGAAAPEDDRVEVGAIIHANAKARKVIEQDFVPALGLRPVAYYEFPDAEGPHAAVPVKGEPAPRRLRRP